MLSRLLKNTKEELKLSMQTPRAAGLAVGLGESVPQPGRLVVHQKEHRLELRHLF